MFPCAFAQNIQTMLIARFLDGLAGSAFLSVAGGTVGDMFAKHVSRTYAYYPLVADADAGAICPHDGLHCEPFCGPRNWPPDRWLYRREYYMEMVSAHRTQASGMATLISGRAQSGFLCGVSLKPDCQSPLSNPVSTAWYCPRIPTSGVLTSKLGVSTFVRNLIRDTCETNTDFVIDFQSPFGLEYR